MVTVPVPDEVLLVFALLPGYVAVRTGLYFARYAGPIDWPEYEKTAVSLVGSGALLTGAGVAFPAVVGVTVENGDVFVTTDVGFAGYVTSVLLAVVLGAALGQAGVTLYERLYGVTRRRVDPREYLLQRLEDPGPARIVTDDRELVGRVKYTDGEGTPSVLKGPRRVTTRDGAEYHQRMGAYAYVAPETVEAVYYESPFRSEAERGGLVARTWRRLRPSPEGDDERAIPEPEARSGPSVTVSKDPLLRETDRVRARGAVRNERDEEIRFLQVKVEFEDGDGRIVGTAVDSFGRLGAGDAWRFDVPYATDEPDSIESVTVKWYASPRA